jgi:hypothetical protein
MNKKLLIGLIVVFIAAGYYYLSTHKQNLKSGNSKPCQYKKNINNQSSACGQFGDVSACPKANQPVMVGENSSIYALGSGTVHDPMIQRECSFNPPILCQGKETEYAFQGNGSVLTPATLGSGNDLADAYGVGGNARQQMLKGNSCKSC